jgi:hypothetical protein
MYVRLIPIQAQYQVSLHFSSYTHTSNIQRFPSALYLQMLVIYTKSKIFMAMCGVLVSDNVILHSMLSTLHNAFTLRPSLLWDVTKCRLVSLDR